MKYDKLNKVTAESVKKATGRNWDEWVEYIDSKNGGKLNHKEIVAILQKSGELQSAWWRQMVTVGYEFAKGRRVIGETADVGFQLGVQKKIPMKQDRLWEYLFFDGLKLWLVDLPPFPVEPGVKFGNSNISGEIRTVKPPHKVRMVLNKHILNHRYTLQFYLHCPHNTEAKTTLSIHLEKLQSEQERNLMRVHWKKILTSLAGSRE